MYTTSASSTASTTTTPLLTLSMKQMKQLQAKEEQDLPKAVWMLVNGTWTHIASVCSTHEGDHSVTIKKTKRVTSTVIRQQTMLQVMRFTKFMDKLENDVDLKMSRSTSSWINDGAVRQRDELEYIVLDVHTVAKTGHVVIVTMQYSHLQDRLRVFAYAVGKFENVDPIAVTASQKAKSTSTATMGTDAPLAPPCAPEYTSDAGSIQRRVFTLVNDIHEKNELADGKGIYNISPAMRNAIKNNSDDLIMTF